MNRPPSGVALLLAGQLDAYLAEDRRLEHLIPEHRGGHLVWLRPDGTRH